MTTEPFGYVIMTRPKAAAERFVNSLSPQALARVKVIYSPLVEILPTGDVPDLAGVAGAIFTSANGARLSPHGLGRPAFCVGRKTSAAAQTNGWRVVTTVATADALVAELTKSPPIGPLVHLCGQYRRGEIAKRLIHAGQQVTEHVLYDQPMLPLNPQAKAVIAGEVPVILPLFSPRTAAHLVDELGEVCNTTAVVMSDAVAQALGGAAFHAVIVAAAPQGDEMARCVENLAVRDRLS